MEPGAPIEMKRGYCFTQPEYLQARKERNPSDTLTQLSRYKATAPHVSAGNGLWGGYIGTFVAGTGALSIGILGATGSPEMSKGASTALIVSGAAVSALSIGLCIMSEGQYATAVDVYNEQVVPKGGAQDIEAPDDNSDPDPEQRTSTPAKTPRPR